MRDSFKTRTTLAVGPATYEIHSLPALQGYDLGRLPFSLKILLENLLRFEDGVNVTREDIEALLQLGCQGGAELRDRVHAGARDHAGLHRRARPSSTSPRCAKRWSVSAATRRTSIRSRPPNW